MTRDEAKELLPIIQAWAEGKKVQFRFSTDLAWEEACKNPNFSLDYEWRIKPEPREYWLVMSEATSQCFRYESKAEAEYRLVNAHPNFRIEHVITKEEV